MPKPNKGPRLGSGPAHERLMLRTMSAQLFEHGRIQTTETKAKRLQPVAERLITFAKRGDLHSRRRVMRMIGDPSIVHVLFEEIAPQVADRQGGYTRVIKTGYRKGDNAPMAVIELVLEPVQPKAKRAAQAEPVQGATAATAAAEADEQAAEAAAGEGDVAETEAVDSETAVAEVAEGATDGEAELEDEVSDEAVAEAEEAVAEDDAAEAADADK